MPSSHDIDNEEHHKPSISKRVIIVDASGNIIASFGGTQYTAGDTQVTPVGTVVLGKDVGNVLRTIPVNDSKHAVGKAVDVQGGFYYTGVWAAGDGTMTPIRTDEEGRTILSADSETIGVSALEAGIKGSSVNGTRALLSANTWYSVPSTVPLNPYILVASFENAVGTIRMGFANSGTPSVTNGNQAPQQVVITLGASEVLYFGSTTAGDDINWTTKELV